MKLVNTILLLILIVISPAYASLYADVAFNVLETGTVQISGNTNYSEFQGTTEKLTSKENGMWTFNLTTPVFSNYSYRIKLPDSAAISYIKSNAQFQIKEESGTLNIIGTENNQQMQVLVQYSLGTTIGGISSTTIYNILIVLAVFIIGFILLKRKKITKKEDKEFNRELFTERQLLILDYLNKNGTVMQAKLEKDLNLPKSSLSRNIDTLAKKGTIFKETKGMSNVIGLK